MKVEIVTLHRITNFGSMLQTYATQTAIEKLGHKAEILDFVPVGMTFRRACWPKYNGSILKKLIKLGPLLVYNLICFSIMTRFIKKYIKVSPRKYSNFKEIIEGVPLADAYLSGSDQVWNTQNHNQEDDLKAYYLGFAPEGKRRIAYAGSFGKNQFADAETSIMKEFIAKYDYISVREDDGLKVLSNLGFTNGVHVVDPTLLLNGEDWRKFASKKKTPKGKYIFVYNLNRNPLIKEIAKAVSKETGLRIINFADSFDFIPGAKNRIGNSALDFVNHIANAELVVTDSFHGTAFSINLNTNFICIKAPRYNSRLESILRLTNLIDSRMVSNLEEGLSASRKSIDFVSVNELINEARGKSYKYLQNALS